VAAVFMVAVFVVAVFGATVVVAVFVVARVIARLRGCGKACMAGSADTDTAGGKRREPA